MKFGNNNLKNAFSKWGKHREVLPVRNDMLKQQILEALPKQAEVSAKGGSAFGGKAKVIRPIGWLKIASALAVFLLVANTYAFFIYRNLPAATSPSLYSEPGNTPKLSGKIEYPDQYISEFGAEQTRSALSSGISSVDEYGKIRRVYNDPVNAPVDDTREFLKTGYNIDIKTRKVQNLATRLQTIIRGYNGRIDNASISTKSAHISFVLPKLSFDKFVLELKDIVPERFIEENISLENKLPQKLEIERSNKYNEDWASDLQNERQSLISSHDAKVATIQKLIDNYNYKILVLQKERSATTSTERWAVIDKDLASFNSQLRYQKQQLADENYKYQESIQINDRNIDNANRMRADLQKQDANLAKDVETVNGYISIQWISFFQMINLYVPIYWLMGGAAVVLLLYFWLGRSPSLNDDLLS